MLLPLCRRESCAREIVPRHRSSSGVGGDDAFPGYLTGINCVERQSDKIWNTPEPNFSGHKRLHGEFVGRREDGRGRSPTFECFVCQPEASKAFAAGALEIITKFMGLRFTAQQR